MTNPFDVSELTKHLPVPSEHAEQVRFCREFSTRYPSLRYFAVPNGARVARSTANNLKAEGMMSGVPDLFIPALLTWVEMKRQRGSTVSPEQKEWHAYLRSLGHTVIIGRGCDDALHQLEEVINQKGLPA